MAAEVGSSFMLSERKALLRCFEIVAWAGAASCLFLASRLRRWPDTELPIELALTAGFALLLLSFLPACVLGAEYARAVRRSENHLAFSDGLNLAELSELLSWAPLACKVAAGSGLALAAYAAIVYGEVSWSTMDPPTREDGIAGALYLASFLLLALPVLASAVRMPGSYAEHFGDES